MVLIDKGGIVKKLESEMEKAYEKLPALESEGNGKLILYTNGEINALSMMITWLSRFKEGDPLIK